MKNYGDCKNTEKTDHPPLKKFILEKNDLLLPKETQRCQTFVAGKVHVLLDIRVASVPKKPRSGEKTKKN